MDPPFFCHQAWRTAFTSCQSPQSSWWKSSNVKSRMVSLRPSVDRQHWTAPWRCALSLVHSYCSWSVFGISHVIATQQNSQQNLGTYMKNVSRHCNSWNTLGWLIAMSLLSNVAMSPVGTTVPAPPLRGLFFFSWFLKFNMSGMESLQGNLRWLGNQSMNISCVKWTTGPQTQIQYMQLNVVFSYICQVFETDVSF